MLLLATSSGFTPYFFRNYPNFIIAIDQLRDTINSIYDSGLTKDTVLLNDLTRSFRPRYLSCNGS